jgi:YHS domain-containing protein
MRKSTLFLAVLALVMIYAVPVSAVVDTSAEDTKVTCIVSGKEMAKSEAKGSTEYKGKTYYFCCEGCEKSFLENPEKYINAEPGEHHSHEAERKESCSCSADDETTKVDKVKDPVCGMEFEKSKAAATAEYNGETYYFCMTGCKDKFLSDPAKYVKSGEKKVTCPVMGTEIAKKDAAGSYEYNGETYYFCCAGCKEKFVKNPEKYAK